MVSRAFCISYSSMIICLIDDNQEEDGTDDAVDMPQDFYPPLWLVFVTFGSISASPHPIFQATPTEATKPLADAVPNRMTVRALGNAERHAITEDSSASKKKKSAAEDSKSFKEILSVVSKLEAENGMQGRYDMKIKYLTATIDMLRGEAVKDGEDPEYIDNLRVQLKFTQGNV